MSALSRKEDRILEDAFTAAKFKFMIHRKKGGWKHKSHDVLYKELLREVEELKSAKGKEGVISECADIINYCAMIIDLAKRKL